MNVMINYMLYTWFQLLILYFRTNMQNEKTLPENNTHTNTRVCVCVMHVNFIISKYVCNNYQASVLKFLRSTIDLQQTSQNQPNVFYYTFTQLEHK